MASTAIAPLTPREEIDVPISFADAVKLAQAKGYSEADTVFVASAYTVMNQDKDALLGVPFYIRNVQFKKDEKYDAEYCIVHVVDNLDRLWVMTDGSTGICSQLRALVTKRNADKHPNPLQDILVANGLRKSEYVYEDAQGKKTPATTYYLA